VFAVFSAPLGPLPPLGSLLDPTTGLWSVAFGGRALQSQTIRVPGLSAPVTIVRDVTGVPHIYAQNAADGWFALGFVHAQDRLWQMDIQYRAAAGRLSEVLGSSYISTDEFFRTIGLARIATVAAAARGAAAQDDTVVMNAYTAGVNAYIAALDPPDYPIEFKLLGYKPESWSVEKSLTVGGLIAWGLMGDLYDLQYDLLVEKFGATQARELFPNYPAGTQTPIQPTAVTGSGVGLVSAEAAQDILRKAAAAAPWIPDFEGAGSNNWAVLGTRTTTGKPLLDADPHLQFQLPAIWYQAELQAPPYSVRGATFPGIPAFFFGTNGRIAWGETNTGADVNDFFVERLSADKTQYLYNGQWYDLSVSDERIGVKGGSAVDFKVLSTRHGPILTDQDQNVSMQSTIVYFGQELEAMLGINRAQNSDEFNASAKNWRVPAQNIIYADANGAYGNVGIRSTGLFPIRGNFSGRLPVDGSNASYGWIGWVPFDSYPHLWDPPQGFVSSNNQVPYPAGYPYASSLGSLFDPGYRARRIHELLSADASVSLPDMERFQLDVLDTAAQSLVPPYLLPAIHPSDGVEQEAYAALTQWDYTTTIDSVAASVWYTFMDHYVQDTFGDEYAAQGATNLSYPQFNTLESLTINDPTSHWFDNVSGGSVKPQTRDDVIRQAFNDTVTDLTARLGPMTGNWRWGSIHSREFDHLSGLSAFQRGPTAAGGDGFTLNVAGGLTSKGGPSWRQIIDFSDLDNSLAIYPGGQSGNPLSIHYADFLGPYMSGEYLSFRAYPAANSIPAASIESTITLVSS
jgi:penicillin amidase